MPHPRPEVPHSLTVASLTERIDHTTKIPANHMAEILPAPDAMKIELTGRCNYRCQFCALTLRDQQPKDDMDFDLFSKIVTQAREFGVRQVGLFYIGESFLNPDLLVKAVALCKKLDYANIFLTTNGSISDPCSVHRVMDAGLTSLKFSFTTADPEQAKEILRTSKKNWEQAKENLKSAWHIRELFNYNCQISASSIKLDGEQQEKMEVMIQELDPFIDQHYWLPLYSFGSLALDRQKEMGFDKITTGNMGRLGNMVSPLPCWCCFTEAHVLHDGRMTLCGFDAGLPGKDWVCGDLKTQDFGDAWNSSFAQQLRRANLKKDVTGTACETCAMYGGE